MTTLQHFAVVFSFLSWFSACSTDKHVSNSSSRNSGVVVIEKNSFEGTPLRCWISTGSASSSASVATIMTDPSGIEVRITAFTTIVNVPDNAWDRAFDLIGISRETCLKLGRRRFDPEREMWADPPASARLSQDMQILMHELIHDTLYGK